MTWKNVYERWTCDVTSPNGTRYELAAVKAPWQCEWYVYQWTSATYSSHIASGIAASFRAAKLKAEEFYRTHAGVEA